MTRWLLDDVVILCGEAVKMHETFAAPGRDSI
jgi:hypothetical protein